MFDLNINNNRSASQTKTFLTNYAFQHKFTLSKLTISKDFGYLPFSPQKHSIFLSNIWKTAIMVQLIIIFQNNSKPMYEVWVWGTIALLPRSSWVPVRPSPCRCGSLGCTAPCTQPRPPLPCRTCSLPAEIRWWGCHHRQVSSYFITSALELHWPHLAQPSHPGSVSQ